MDRTGISWTDSSWNPWRGCERISAGCANCYMFAEQRRYGQDPAKVQRTKTWGAPRKWQREAAASGTMRLVFTCSWSDFFIEEADEWRPEAWEVMRACPNLIFQVLTKRPERIAGNVPPGWPYPNVWMGVSAENRKQGLPRIDLLREIPAVLRFLSCEPLLEDLGQLDLEGIGWVIVGGESGPVYRPMAASWARSILRQCQEQQVPFFFKQGAAFRPGQQTGLLGRVYQDFPALETA